MEAEHASRVAQVDSLVGSVQAMTKAEFDRIRLNELARFSVSGTYNIDFDSSFEFQQVVGWENKYRIKANKTIIDGVLHEYNDTDIVLSDAPDGLQNKDLATADFTNLAAAIVSGGNSLSSSYLNQRHIIMFVQEDVAANSGLSTAYIQDAKNNIYSDDGVLRQRTASFVAERILESVELTKNDHWQNTVNCMASLGWTLSDDVKGQWEKDGKIAVGIAIVQRRNQGAYHPTFSPNGVAAFWKDAASPTYKYTWESALILDKATSLSECFTKRTQDPLSLGQIGSAVLGRSDDKFYDAIYASDVEDLRMSSKRLPRKEIREKYKRMAIAGEVRGYEGVPFTTIGSYTTGAGGFGNILLVPDETIYSVGDVIYPEGVATTYLANKVVSVTVGSITVEDSFTRVVSGNIVRTTIQTHKQANPTWTDIIGDPANILATFPNGVEGQWIPDYEFLGFRREYAATRKILSTVTKEYTIDNGVTWVASTLPQGTPVNMYDSTTNTIDIVDAVGSVGLYHYETQAHFTGDDAGITKSTPWSSVYATNNNTEAVLTSSLIGEVATGTDPSEELSITKVVSDVISHTAETLTPVVKCSTAIGVKDSQAYLMFNVDDNGVIDSSNIKATALPYFIDEGV